MYKYFVNVLYIELLLWKKKSFIFVCFTFGKFDMLAIIYIKFTTRDFNMKCMCILRHLCLS